MRTLATLLISSLAAFAQYKAEAAGAPPAELNPAIAATLHKTGHKILNPDGSVMCEVWLVASNPKASAGPEEASTLAVVQGSLVGAIRFPTKASTRCATRCTPSMVITRARPRSAILPC
ncbi:MAG: hypothetical protein NTV70_02095 [Acidobacteria bacterium]|nr:hypothetical protein [Acidobacteriota bacterium]